MKAIPWLVLITCLIPRLAGALTATTLAYPVEGYVPGSYAGRSFFVGHDHLGEDIDLSAGTPVKAIGNGKIVAYQTADGYGELAVVIEHDLGRDYAFINAYGKIVVTRKILSIYGHLRKRQQRDGSQSLSWKFGDEVHVGDVIGYVNNSSHPDGQSSDPNGDGLEHLHLGIRLQSYSEAIAADPGKWFRGYEKSTDQGKYFASADAVIQIARDKGMQELCALRSASTGAAICWEPSSSSDVRCTQAKSWVVYHSYTNMVRVTTNAYCPTTDSVFAYYGNGMPSGPLGGGGISITFNLKQDTDILDPATGTEWIAGQKLLVPGMTVSIRTDVKAVNGNTTTYMRPGKDKVEVDFYVRLDGGEWNRISRQNIRATNLSSGSTKTESVLYTIPNGFSEVSFKVKIDAEDEAYESNEGDNWSRIETFDIFPLAAVFDIIFDD